MKKKWYKGLTATAVTLAVAGAAVTVPAFADEVETPPEPTPDVVPEAGQTVTEVTNEDGSTTKTTVTVSESEPTKEKPEETEDTEVTTPIVENGKQVGEITIKTETDIVEEEKTTTEEETVKKEETTVSEENTDVSEKVNEALGEAAGTTDWGAVAADSEFTIGDKTYTVVSNTPSEDGKTHTITMSNSVETDAPVTADELVALLGLGEGVTLTPNEDGTYSYTKENGDRVSISVAANEGGTTGTNTTTVTLTLTVKENTEQAEGSATIQDNPVTDITDDVTPAGGVSVEDALALADKEGVTVERDSAGNITKITDGTKTYEFGYTPTSDYSAADLTAMTADEIVALLGSGYTANDGKVYDAQGHELSVTETQTILRKVNVTVTVTDTHGSESTDTVYGQTEDAAKAAAQEQAIKNALAAAAAKEGLTVNADSITLTEAVLANGKWEYTSGGKTYTFTFSANESTSGTHADWTAEKISEVETATGADISSGSTTEVNGSASVSGSTITWTENKTASGTEAFISGDKVVALAGATDIEYYDEAKTQIKSFTVGNQKYEFSYGTPSEEEKAALLAGVANGVEITDSSLTKISWTITTTTTSTSTPNTPVSIGPSIEESTDGDGQTVYTYKDGLTEISLTLVEAGVYKDADGKIYTVTTAGTDSDAVISALNNAGYENVVLNADGTATGTKDGVEYTITYSSVGTQITIEESNYLANSDKDALIADVEALIRAAQNAGKVIILNGHKIDEKTTQEQWEVWLEEGSVVNFEAMDKDDLVDLLEGYAEGSTQKYFQHIDLNVASELTLPDATAPVDCVVMRDGLTMIRNSDAETLVYNGTGSSTSFKQNISWDSQGDGHYEYQHPDNAPNSGYRAYYKVTGTVAYNKVENVSYSAKKYSEAYVTELAQNNYGSNAVAVLINGRYYIYRDTAPLTAYGYMTDSSNNCSFGYDLMLGSLTMLEDGKVVASGQGVTTYSTTVKTAETKTNTSLTITGLSSKSSETTDPDSDIVGTYTVSCKEEKQYDSAVTGTGLSSFDLYRTWMETEGTGSAAGGKYDGTLRYTYEVPAAPTITAAQTTEVTRTIDATATIETTETLYKQVTTETVTETRYAEEEEPIIPDPYDPPVPPKTPTEPEIVEPEPVEPDVPVEPTIPDEVIDDIIDEVDQLISVPQTGVETEPNSYAGAVPAGVLALAVAGLLKRKRKAE